MLCLSEKRPFCQQILRKTAKKLVFILTTFALMTGASKKIDLKVQKESALKRVPYIYYFAQFSGFFCQDAH